MTTILPRIWEQKTLLPGQLVPIRYQRLEPDLPVMRKPYRQMLAQARASRKSHSPRVLQSPWLMDVMERMSTPLLCWQED